MKKIEITLSLSLVIVLLFFTKTIHAQKVQLQPVQRKGEVQVLEATKDQRKKIIPQNELTPAQKKALKRKQTEVNHIRKAKAAKQKNAANQRSNVKKPTGSVQKLNLQQQKGVRMTAADISKRKKDISKAKAISTINKGNGRVKAGEAKLAAAKAKLKTAIASGKYTEADINEKQKALAVYEEYLMRLKKSIEMGHKHVNIK